MADPTERSNEPLIEPKQVAVDINEEGGEQAQQTSRWRMPTCSEALFWLYANIPLAIVIICCVLSIIFFAMDFVLAGSFCMYLGIVAILGTCIGSGQIISLGGMARQINRFKQENDRLEKTSSALTKQVSNLEETNEELSVEVDKLESTVDSLKEVSDGLQDQLEQFESLSKNLEDMAKKTGQNVQQVLGQSADLYKKIKGLTVQNERVLLERIAQDLEFMDRDVGMSKAEFDRFCGRIPKNLQAKFTSLNISYEELAGEDKIVDYGEIQALIDSLMEENSTKQTLLKSAKEMSSAGKV
eukprot:TRINITY_DN1552_c0_g1_i1.p1 TRINITY_DN1552_c0_g1~~TRINITY_DN1552_c0_g1_i1.p1  ORF type:complete len:299 (+),score=40.67 TRINITY_DN1552_c0_g1_i1:55-951(+)